MEVRVVSNSFFDGLLSGDVVLSLVEEKALGPTLGRGSAFDRFDPNAWDGDGDGLVQEGTPFERPAIPGVNTDLPNVPNVPQVPVSNNKEVRIYDEISGSSRSMRAGINTARFPKLKRRRKMYRDLDIPQIIKEKTGTVDDGEASKLLAIKLANLERQLDEGRITYGEYNSERIISLVEYKRDRSLEQSETKAAFKIPREISGIGETGEDGNVIGFVNLIRFSSMHNGIRYLHSDDPSEMGLGPLVDRRGDAREVAKRYPAELRLEGIRTLESMNQDFEEYLQQLRDGSGWDFPLTVSMGFSFIEKKDVRGPNSAVISDVFTNHLYLENEEIPKYLAGIAYSLERATGEGYEGKIDIATADRIAKLLSKSWTFQQQYRGTNTGPEEMYDINMIDIFSPEDEIPGLPYFMPLGVGESGKKLDTMFDFPFDKDGADVPVVIKRGLRIHQQETTQPTEQVKKEIVTRYFFDTHQPEVLETKIIENATVEERDGRRIAGRETNDFFPNTENPNLQVGKIESPELNNSPFSSYLERPQYEGSTARMDLQTFPFRITKDGIPYKFEPSFSVDEQPAIKRINEFLKEIGIPETKASETDSLYVPSEFDPRYLVVNGPLETPGKNEQRPKSYLDKLREAAAVYENTDPDFKKLKQINGRMAKALLKKQSTRQTDDDETISVWVPEELVADNASIDASQREPQAPSSTSPAKQDMAQKIRERKIRKNLGLSDDEPLPPEYGGDSSRSKRENKLTPVKTTFTPDKKVIFTGNARKLNRPDWKPDDVDDDDEIGITSSDGDGVDLIIWEDQHPDYNVYISEGELHFGFGEKVRLIAVRHKLTGESSESQDFFISFEISEDEFNELSSIIGTQKEVPKSISDRLNKLSTARLKEIEDLARFVPEKSFRDLGHIHFADSKLHGQENVGGYAAGYSEYIGRRFVAIRDTSPANKLIKMIFPGQSSTYGVLSHEFGHVVDKPLPETPESKKLQEERRDLIKRANQMLGEGNSEEFFRLTKIANAIRIPERIVISDSE